MAFVEADATRFTLANQPFYFAGSNTYYLIYKSKFMVDAVLDGAKSLGLRVIRTWGFLDMGSLDGSVASVDPPGPKEGVYFQYWGPESEKPVYNDGATGLEHLDYAIYAAGQRGLKVILPLVNNWTDFGGVDQYVTWYALTSHNDFFADLNARQAYKKWVEHVLDRTNVYTHTKYRDDSTIMAWELINEPRCIGDRVSLLSWVAEMSRFIKQIDPVHLVAVGDEGFFNRSLSTDWTYNGSQGVDFEAFLGLSTIDFGTFHLYPDGFGKSGDFAAYWIDDHLAAGFRAGKPVVLTEYGSKDQATRDSVYQSWLNRIYAQAGAGDLFWMLASEQDDGSLYPDFDGYTVYSRSAPASIRAHADAMAART